MPSSRGPDATGSDAVSRQSACIDAAITLSSRLSMPASLSALRRADRSVVTVAFARVNRSARTALRRVSAASRRSRSATSWCSVSLCSCGVDDPDATCWASACRNSWMAASRVTTASRKADCCLFNRACSCAFSSSNWQSRLMSARLAAPTRCDSICTSPNASRMTARVAAGGRGRCCLAVPARSS
jgi:hypothetical protein